MSADNGIYVAKFPDGYRVAHCQCIEDVDFYAANTFGRKSVLKVKFGRSKVYATKNEALLAGHEMEQEIRESDWPGNILEYGVSYIGEYEHWQ